jgi:hypothetical protein
MKIKPNKKRGPSTKKFIVLKSTKALTIPKPI